MLRPWRRCAAGRLARRARTPSSFSTQIPRQQRRHVEIGIQPRPRPKFGRADVDIRQMVRASARQPVSQPRREGGDASVQHHRHARPPTVVARRYGIQTLPHGPHPLLRRPRLS
jgi:hypothetical protein